MFLLLGAHAPPCEEAKVTVRRRMKGAGLRLWQSPRPPASPDLPVIRVEVKVNPPAEPVL